MLFSSGTASEHECMAEGSAERQALVERIAISPYFARSQRLSEFLRFVSHLAEQGRADEINEQSIGVAVFDRSRDYDPTIDSIVRSHASRLRHRLKAYFENEGAGESLVLSIPRGSYIPHFEMRRRIYPSSSDEDARQENSSVQRISDVSPTGETTTAQVAANEPVLAQLLVQQKRRIVHLRIALAISMLIALMAIIVSVWTFRTTGVGHDKIAKRHLLWRQFLLPGDRSTLVVCADSGLTMLQRFTGHPVSLPEYVSGEYLKNITTDILPHDQAARLGVRRYTPFVDLFVHDRILRLFGEENRRVTFRFARDLHIGELKQGNTILLGTHESDPWVSLYEPSMNFSFERDASTGVSKMINKHPRSGEQNEYAASSSDPAQTVYGVVAFRPNLDQSGNVLILEGHTMAGTQAAVDFVFNDAYLLPFLKRIQKGDGSIPFFEVLVRSSALGGESSRIEPVVYRVDNN